MTIPNLPAYILLDEVAAAAGVPSRRLARDLRRHNGIKRIGRPVYVVTDVLREQHASLYRKMFTAKLTNSDQN